MKSVNELLDDLNSRLNESSEKSESGMPSEAVMDKLWWIMAALYADKWRHPDSAKGAWSQALIGINGPMIAKGLLKMIQNGIEWPPSAISFRALCLPTAEDYGLLDESEAFQQAVGNRTVKSAEVIHTLRQMGNDAYRLRNHSGGKDPEQTIRNIWAKWYGQTLEHVAHGGELDLPPLELKQDYTPAGKDSEIAKKAISDWKGMFDDESS